MIDLFWLFLFTENVSEWELFTSTIRSDKDVNYWIFISKFKSNDVYSSFSLFFVWKKNTNKLWWIGTAGWAF